MINEKRRFLRVPLSLAVLIKDMNGVEVEAFTGTLSAGGLFLETFNPLPVDHEVSIEMHLPESIGKTLITGKVVWVRNKYVEEFPPGMGIKFVNMARKDHVKIDSIVLKILEGRGDDL